MPQGFRVLVCGSGRFTDAEVVFGLLNAIHAQFKSPHFTVISGDWSSGADQFTREWAQANKVSYEELRIPESDKLDLSFFDASRELPRRLLEKDPLFSKGFRNIQKAAPDLLVVIPSPDGKLGPTTACIQRMADVIDLPCLDGEKALAHIHSHLSESYASQMDSSSQHSDSNLKSGFKFK